jgi:hypothetical protein
MLLLGLGEDGSVREEFALRGPWSDAHQKNWMPLVDEEDLLFIYSLSPTRVLRWDPERRRALPLAENHTPLALEHLRGGSQLLPIPGGWLGICHEACHFINGRRRYLHRFFSLGDGWLLDGLSEAFTFTGADIEFCAGLALEADGQTLLASFGVMDERAYLASFVLDRVLEALEGTTSVA